MNTLQAFENGRAARARGAERMVFDWEKAARLIKERNPREASAGLEGDWEWTGGDIFRDGKPVPRDETYTYLASIWATPQLSLDGDVIACYRMDSEVPNWGAETYWPEEAMRILRGEVAK